MAKSQGGYDRATTNRLAKLETEKRNLIDELGMRWPSKERRAEKTVRLQEVYGQISAIKHEWNEQHPS